MHLIAFVSLVAQASTDDGLTLAKLLQRIPTDPASLLTLALLSGSLFAVLWFGNKSGGAGGKSA